ncbi:hypothetical protein G6L37_01965 [Agrobacterium rubi]|nr:hypothetical protein [Agrobacterium rubi]NTF24159.1 hypothetical protein [Agrobacterium rubi]
MSYPDRPEGPSPYSHSNGHVQWSFPANSWSGAQYGEDMIEITLHVDGHEWWGSTEMDQCVKRDLDDEDILQIRRECGLDGWVTVYYPDYLDNQTPSP